MIGTAEDGDATAILLRAVHRIRKAIVGDDVLQLRRGLVIPCAPRLAAIDADGGALIRRQDHVRGISRINPELVIIVAAGGAANDRNRLAGIIRAVERDVRDVENIWILRIDGDVAEVPGAAGEPGVGALESPCVTTIVGTVEARFLCVIDNCVNALTIWRHSDAGASPIAVRKTRTDEALPGIAAIFGAEDSATCSVNGRIGAPRRTMRVPSRGQQSVGTIGCNGEIGDANFRALVEDFRPMVAAIGGLIDAALVIGTVRMSKRADVNDVCILRIDDNTADLTRVAQADILPAHAAIGGAVHSVAGGEVGANVGFSSTDVNDFGIRGSDGNSADRSNGLTVEDGRPGYSRVRGLPDAATNRAEVKRAGIAGNSGGRDSAAAPERPD